MKKIKVVQIGAMHDHSSQVMGALKKLSDRFELLGYAVPEEEVVTVERVYDGIKRMSVEEALNIPELDAVIIETSELNLAKYALMAAEKGLHIHMDKPGGTSLSDFERLVETVRKNGTVFHLGYMYRHNPAVVKILQDIEDSKFGEIYCVEAQMNCMHTPEKREWLSQFKGGQMFFLGCHLIDLIYQIMGKPEQVIPMNLCTGIDGVSSEDYGFAVFKYKNGISFAKSCAVEPAGFLRRQLVVCGSKGKVQLLPFEVCTPNGQYTEVCEVFDKIGDWHLPRESYRTEEHDRYLPMINAFADYVSGEKQNPYTYSYELELYKLILQACGIE